MQKYNVYTGELKDLTRSIKYSHYDNETRRLLIFVPKKPKGDWKKLSQNEINSLSQHEKHWYNRSRNEINAAYLSSPTIQIEQQKRMSKMLDIYEQKLKILKEQQEDDNRNGEI